MAMWQKYTKQVTHKQDQKNQFQIQPLSPKHKDFLNTSNAYMNILVGSVRSGKTISAILRFYKHIINSPHTDFCMAGATLGSLKRNVVKPFLRILDSYNIDYIYNKFENEILLTEKNKLITLFGIEKSGSEDKIKGFTSAGSLVDEATAMNDEGVRMLISRNSLSDSKIFITCNPVNPYNFLYTDYVNNQELIQSGKCKVYNFLLEDNLTLTSEYIENLKAMYPQDSVFYKRNILGQWVSGQGIIFDKFTDDNIFNGEVNLEDYDYIGVSSDYGTSTTTCYSLIGVKEHEDYNSFDLIMEYGYDATQEASSQTDVERVDDIYDLQNENKLGEENVFYCSHDAGSLKAALEKDKRINMTIESYMPDTLECIQTMSSLFYKNQLRIHESCTETIKQIKSYEWDSKASQRGEDKPIKKDDHYIDSMRAMIMNHLFVEDESYSDIVYV